MKYVSILTICFFALVFPRGRATTQTADLHLETGNDFLRQCDEERLKHDEIASIDALALQTSHSMQWARCMGYIQGFLEGQSALLVRSGVRSEALAGSKLGFCAPGDL